jgi:hypothetical protein
MPAPPLVEVDDGLDAVPDDALVSVVPLLAVEPELEVDVELGGVAKPVVPVVPAVPAVPVAPLDPVLPAVPLVPVPVDVEDSDAADEPLVWDGSVVCDDGLATVEAAPVSVPPLAVEAPVASADAAACELATEAIPPLFVLCERNDEESGE